MKYFVTGIDTDIGKTVVSAILTEAGKADYWKPVQAGGLDETDSMRVENLIQNEQSRILDETYKLKTPMSPHAAAAIEQITINPINIALPETTNNLIIEGAGGLMVPLNEDYLIVDLIRDLHIPVILVSKNYLGSINHTLLSLDCLKNRGLTLAGILFNGDPNPESERIICAYSNVQNLGGIPWKENPDKSFIHDQAERFRFLFYDHFAD